MELTTENVKKILYGCFFNAGEDTTNHIKAQGVRGPLGFHPERLENHRSEIEQLLKQLPIEFMKSGGGGSSFLNACCRADGEQWGEQSNVDELICLGVAIGRVHFLAPRNMWAILPGGMPYFFVDDSSTSDSLLKEADKLNI